MALKKAGAPEKSTRRADGSVEEVPEGIPRGRGGRPKIRALLPDGTDSPDRFASYTRASTLGKALESDHAIQVWKQRMITFGMSRRSDLVALASAIRTTEEPADKEALGDVAERALEAAKGSAGATRGTALHLLSEQHDAGADLSHLPPNILEALRVYRRLMESVEVVASEQFVVNDALETAGTYDRVVSLREPATAPNGARIETGERLVIDLKTSKDAKYFGPTYSCQQAVYATGIPYSHAGGRGEWPVDETEPHDTPLGPRTDWSLILHVPPDSLADAGWYWVDLRQGYELAELARLVRAQSGRDDLFHPAELAAPGAGVPAQVLRVGLVAKLRAAASRAELDAIYDEHASAWDDDCTRMARARLTELAMQNAGVSS